MVAFWSPVRTERGEGSQKRRRLRMQAPLLQATMTMLRRHPLFAFPILLAIGSLLCAQEAQKPTPVAPAAPVAEAPQHEAIEVAPVLEEELAAAIRREGIENTQVMRILRDMTGKIGHRLTGSDNFTKACAWAATEFHAMGVPVVKLEKWGEWKLAWNRGAWKGRITSPVPMELYVATEAWTAGTNGPREGVIVKTPETVEAVTKEAVGSKWLFYKKAPKSDVRKACESFGILGWVYRAGDADDKFPTRVRVFGDSKKAMLTIDEVPTIPQIAVRPDQADQLEKLLEGTQAVHANFDIENTFRDGGIPLYNVIAEIPGSEKPEEIVIVSSHLDSWHQAQGCTDNGTGSSTTMESARILMAVGAKPKRTIRFCLWGGEEQGLLGSAAYVKMHRAEMEKVSAVFNHDSGTNWAGSIGVTEGMWGPMQSVVAPMLALAAPDKSHEGPVFQLNKVDAIAGGGGSDHASFITAGVPGLNWSLKGRANYFAYSWHTQWDTYEVAIPEYQRHTATVIALAALGTANLPEMLDRSGVRRSGGGRQAGSYAEALFDGDMDGFKFTALKAEGRGAKMGIQVGDVLQKANGQKIEAMHEVFSAMRELGEDVKTMELELLRGTTTVKVQMDITELRNRRRGSGGGAGGADGGAQRGGK